MARSNPTILSADIPAEAQPDNTFPVDVRVQQNAPDPWASEDSCTAEGFEVLAWKTPVRLFVDGDQVDGHVGCMGTEESKAFSLSTSLSEGTHEVEVRVLEVGGNAYDLDNEPWEVNDTRRQTVEVRPDASDPSVPDSGDRIVRFFERIADALGSTTQTVAIGMLAAVLLLVVV